MVRPEALHGEAARVVQTLYCLANGFIVTSLLWGAALAALIDGRTRGAAAYLGVAGVLALFGVIHSPLRDAVIDLPHHVVARLEALPTRDARDAGLLQTPYHWAAAYALAAGFFLLLGWSRQPPPVGEGQPGEAAHYTPVATNVATDDSDTVVMPPEKVPPGELR
jgi:AGZA family xanthine/uracil permease-like MFS transporter